jgi:hypothetical protein
VLTAEAARLEAERDRAQSTARVEGALTAPYQALGDTGAPSDATP